MASSRPGESNGGATGSTLPSCRKLEPFSDDAVSFFLKYDISAAAAFMSSLRHYPVMEQIEITKKNLELFRKPDSSWGVAEEDEDEEYDYEVDKVDGDEDDEVDEAEEEEKGGGQEILKLMVDDKKLATDGQHHVPNEGEREPKKPRLAEGSGCQGEAEAVI